MRAHCSSDSILYQQNRGMQTSLEGVSVYFFGVRRATHSSTSDSGSQLRGTYHSSDDTADPILMCLASNDKVQTLHMLMYAFDIYVIYAVKCHPTHRCI